jgi:hypothetical protein
MLNISSLGYSYKTIDEKLIFEVVSKNVYSIPFALLTLNLKNLAKSTVNEINMLI